MGADIDIDMDITSALHRMAIADRTSATSTVAAAGAIKFSAVLKRKDKLLADIKAMISVRTPIAALSRC